MSRRSLSGILISLLVPCLFVGPAAWAQSKQQMADELASMTDARLKSDSAARTRYEQLSALLGGDAPRSVVDNSGGGVVGGGPAPPPGCTIGIATAASTDTPIAIPDGPGGMVSSTVDLTATDSYTYLVFATIDITHTFASDLEITLTSPGGTVVTLTTDNGGGNDDVFSGTTFDDFAGSSNPPGPVTDVTYANLVVETPVAPEEAMGAFRGEDPNGTWTLDVTDDAGLDTGTLNSWSVTVFTLATPPVDTVEGNFPSADTPIAIPDGPGGMITSSIAVSGAASFTSDIDVTLDVTHTFASDLEITLTSPAGTVVTLTTDNGGGNDDVFAGTTFDDDAGDVNAPGPVSDVTYANLVVETPVVAEEALSAFNGEDPNGTWTLEVVDDAGLDTGTLNSWSLDIETCECTIATPVTEIPTVDTIGLLLLVLMLVTAALAVMRRRRQATDRPS